MIGHTSIEKITEEELMAIENDFDPIEAPPGPYKVQPENQGKIEDKANSPINELVITCLYFNL